MTSLLLMRSCILSKFYIKPQQINFRIKAFACCLLSKFYIKPQLVDVKGYP